MREALKELIRSFLQVPPEPEAPLGGAGSLRVFRAAPGFFRYRLLAWGVRQASFLFGVVAVIVVRSAAGDPAIGGWLGLIEAVALAFFLVQLLFSFLLLALDYEYRWYMVTDRSLRIREGVLKVQERTMTFSNIQNVSIRQGPLQRLFGISDLEVRTAGGGGGSEGGGKQQQGLADNLHLGFFRGVANAAEIRDAILAHLRRMRSAGLGDPDDAAAARHGEDESAPPQADAGNRLLAAGRQVLAEARALREAVG